MTIFNKTCTFNVGNGALLMTKVTSLRLCLCQFLSAIKKMSTVLKCKPIFRKSVIIFLVLAQKWHKFLSVYISILLDSLHYYKCVVNF